MSYTGNVRPAGPVDTRQLDEVTITKFSVGDMDNNVYLLRSHRDRRTVLIDAADDPDRIEEVLGDAELAAIITTHQHWDHVRALPPLARRTGAASFAHVDDAEDIPAVTATVSDGDILTWGDIRLEVIHLKGHTPGAIALLYRDPAGGCHLFTGDSLFPGGPGKTSGPTDFESLMSDLRAKVFTPLPDDTWVYPGHGKDTTLGTERPHLDEWQARGW